MAVLLAFTGSQDCLPSPSQKVIVASLPASGTVAELARLRAAFVAANPGYDLEYQPALSLLAPSDRARLVFVQQVAAGQLPAVRPQARRPDLPEPGPMVWATLVSDAGSQRSLAGVGDLVTVRPGQALEMASPVGALIFQVPAVPADEVPTFIRPDWDPLITDVVGGCATEEGAYRRILLTWLGDNGPYTFRALNAHRVRITDSFTHYHPMAGGFDELYLVQMARPGAKLLTSTQVAAIESAEITAQQAAQLFDQHELKVGDLIYIPRGTIHRGLGGALVQVITAPGFRPGAEIGVDHHLLAINQRLSLSGERAIPYHPDAARKAVVK